MIFFYFIYSINLRTRDALFSISYWLSPFLFFSFFFGHKISLMEVLHKSKAFKKTILSSNSKHNLYNSHSSKRSRHRLKGASGGGRTDAVRPRSGGRRVECRWRQQLGIAMSHKHNAHRVHKVYKTLKKIPSRGYCHAINMLTRLRRQSRVSLSLFFSFFKCPVLAVGGWFSDRDPPPPTLCLKHRWNPRSTVGRRLSRPLTFLLLRHIACLR